MPCRRARTSSPERAGEQQVRCVLDQASWLLCGRRTWKGDGPGCQVARGSEVGLNRWGWRRGGGRRRRGRRWTRQNLVTGLPLEERERGLGLSWVSSLVKGSVGILPKKEDAGDLGQKV